MNELKTFIYKDTRVRTVEINGEPWFVLKDVCEILELSTPARVAERLDEDEKGMSLIHTLGGAQEMTVINESGLYNVILRSDKPEARPFRKWVTSEVLPTIRRTGGYLLNGISIIDDPSKVASLINSLRGVMKDQRSAPAKIATMAEGICRQFGITIPPDFVEVSPWEQLTIDRKGDTMRKQTQDKEILNVH